MKWLKKNYRWLLGLIFGGGGVGVVALNNEQLLDDAAGEEELTPEVNMRHFFLASLAFAGIVLCPVARCQTDKRFPTDDEIKLVMTQTERALSDYSASVKLEEQLAKSATDVDNDRHVLRGLTDMSKAFNARPQAFNSPLGFEFILLLDDASRNAALCNAGAIQSGIGATLGQGVHASQEYLQLAQSCTNVTNLLYTISENAGALYQRYVNGEESLAKEAFDAMNRCVATLKQQKPK